MTTYAYDETDVLAEVTVDAGFAGDNARATFEVDGCGRVTAAHEWLDASRARTTTYVYQQACAGGNAIRNHRPDAVVFPDGSYAFLTRYPRP